MISVKAFFQALKVLSSYKTTAISGICLFVLFKNFNVLRIALTAKLVA